MIGDPQVPRSGKPWKSQALWVLKLGFTALLLWLAFRNVHLSALSEAWGRVHVWWAVGTVLVYVPLCVLFESARLWAMGKRVAAPPLSLRDWSLAFLESRPWFYLLPASAGADGMIWYRLRGRGWSHGGCGFTLISVRFWGLALWALIAGLTLILAPETRNILVGAPTWLVSPGLWLGGGGVVLASCVLAPHWLAHREHVDLKPSGAKDLLLNFCLTLLSAFLTAGCVWMAARSVGVPLSLPACFGLLAWLNFAMALPLSLGGLGLQEALVLRLGLPMGLPAASLLAFSVIVHLTRAVLAVAGGLAGLLDPERPTADQVPGIGLPLPAHSVPPPADY